MKRIVNKIHSIVITLIVLAVVLFIPLSLVWANQSPSPTISTHINATNNATITATFSEAIPSGNIVDFELYNDQNSKVWQTSIADGGMTFTVTTHTLPIGSYELRMGLFTANWSSNYAWYTNLATVSIGTSPSTAPSVNISSVSASIVNITVTVSASVPAGNIVDFEVYDASHNKVWQATSTEGGTKFSMNTSSLPKGTYQFSLGLFTPNWANNYGWYSNLASFSLPTSSSVTPTASFMITPTLTLTPTPTPASAFNNATILSSAQSAYADWKAKYIAIVDGGSARVIRPENNNDTVSEGIGYGMLVSVFAQDKATFNQLWNYAQKYLDKNGLMNWNISSNGSVIGSGSATDADEDMAYALLRANAQWPGSGYDAAAKKLIQAIKTTEVVNNNLFNPGDNWGKTITMNPSYLAPSYYVAFAGLTGDGQWNTIATANSNWIAQAANASTGLTPDWLNADFSQAVFNGDAHANDFYYDALRTPIRMLLAYKTTGDTNAKTILQKEASFWGSIGTNKLVSGYTLPGAPIDNYLDTAFLSAYAAAGQIDPSSSYATSILNKLISTPPSGYFGSTLRVLTLFIIAQ